jgi:RNA polymerase sigma-70 factor (ECF subfamily)
LIDLVEAYKNHSKKIYTYIYLRVNKKQDIAEDILQETFLKAFKYKDKFDSSLSNEKTWITTIAKNLVTDYYKSRYKYIEESIDKAEDLPVSEETDIETNIVYTEIVKALDLLSDKDKELIIMRYINEFDLEEISKMLDITYDNAKVSVNRALNKLRNLVK